MIFCLLSKVHLKVYFSLSVCLMIVVDVHVSSDNVIDPLTFHQVHMSNTTNDFPLTSAD